MEPVIPKFTVTKVASGRHMTDITLDDVCRSLDKLTTQGMDTHDDCESLVKSGRRLLSVVQAMADDLAEDHNVGSKELMSALAEVANEISGLIRHVARMAKACLEAAELSEAEETAMNRDHRPVADATVDAGLLTPSARVHNEN
ncbi:hypothetical protein OHA98_41075 [Streptomyces sp. NBC_00654]|uniref:hypothetical protein n=1 Tax=Streptomyces sp. NBC_00654 TaxID=2975799 RepID=UPI0022592355|nr:hypothetical protein [Streptomyces sp. NBC_00654]MCX4971009.1 hypothetical protein [Streptomyces sp. NBC_00654]